MKKRFTKGQTIFSVCTRFCADYENNNQFIAVVERVVDACGAKQVTFFDRGKDSIYGRSDAATSPFLFDNSDDAFAFADQLAKEYSENEQKRDWKKIKTTFHVYRAIISDADELGPHAAAAKANA